ncbi:sigma-70 family RNA polymerase sigma factor [Pelagibacterium nitratireducens]|jgi:RNA polymerase sigma-70 factor, ECF subfamily|uniref:Sigma-70 family RNA polymerase sigma factor n=1 Tax=Pelagibacterium nitratireducens TaxID=1046114 RepID=A0ABZ2I3U0_9HYPH|nr:RNA polymerase subunit sigma [Pelagibacterium sp.]HCO54881.1 RNA polymerase subunit sigma [Pelagibacterium sp.]|tara:strand:+ start:3184 stop:3726 length:543 start_codon:yes stop_codon:yes gene_type:complete
MADTAEIADLLARIALRDRNAFRALYARTSAKLFGVSLRILSNRSEAEDALQDVFIKVWQRAEGYRPDAASPMTWLITIARNNAIDRLRARRPGHTDIDEAFDLEDSGMSPEQSAINTDDGNRIDECMGQLKPERAEAVRRAYVEGESYNELADRLGVPLNTVRTWLRRSLLALRDCLGA